MALAFPTDPAPNQVQVRVTRPAYVSVAQDLSRQAVETGAHSVGASLVFPPKPRAEINALLGFLEARRHQAEPMEMQIPGISNPSGLGLAGCETSGENRVKWSERPAYASWTKVNATVTDDYEAGPAAIGRQASAVYNSAAYGQVQQEIDGEAGAQRLVASAYVKEIDASAMRLALWSLAGGRHYVIWDWTAGAPVFSSQDLVDAYGATAVGGGWYRIWLRVDVQDRGLHLEAFQLQFSPAASAGDGTGTAVIGLQAERNATSPGPYIWTRDTVQAVDAGPQVAVGSNMVTYSDYLDQVPATNVLHLATQYSGALPATPYEDQDVNDGPFFYYHDTASTPGYLQTANLGAMGDDVVASVYIRKDIAGNAGAIVLGIRRGQSGTLNTIRVAGLGSDSPAVDATVNQVAAHGVEAVPNAAGWYRIWLHVDALAQGWDGDSYCVYLEADDSERAGYGAWLYGLQAETGRASPSAYVPTMASAVSGTLSNATELAVIRMTPNTSGVLLAGDFFKMAGHPKLYRATADLDADATGAGRLYFEPPLRQVPSLGEQVVIEQVPLTCTLTSPAVEHTVIRPDLVQLQLDVEEYQ